jgi:hypothetical protein
MTNLIDRLRRVESSGDPECSTCHYRNPDGPEAAREIERLRAENNTLRWRITKLAQVSATWEKQADEWKRAAMQKEEP